MSTQIAAQMFTVRAFTKTAADFAASLKKIADIGYPAVQLSAVEVGVKWYAVEQDQCFRDPFDCLKSSFDFLRTKGI